MAATDILGQDFAQGIDIGTKVGVGGKKGGLAQALSAVAAALQEAQKRKQDNQDSNQLLGVKGLMEGKVTPVAEGTKGSLGGIVDGVGLQPKDNSDTVYSQTIDPTTGQPVLTPVGKIGAKSKIIKNTPGMSSTDIDTAAQALVSGQEVPSQLSGFSKQKQQVINRAMQIDSNYNPAKADMDFAVNKMGAGAFVKNYNNLDSFHKDFELNSDYLLSLSKNFDRSQIPLLNRAIVTGANEIQGNPKATQILQAVNTVANGYARLQNPSLSGQALSDASRKESQDLINGFQSDTQMQALLDPNNGSMRIDANNRMQAAKTIKDQIQQAGSGYKPIRPQVQGGQQQTQTQGTQLTTEQYQKMLQDAQGG